ncbi:hypothetical protein ABER99_21560 [Paenibacillus glucanolyticus]|uniref:Uncharacterized protein n=1 Tax=Paenibacillus glucanolyticus TaxID=59843 RepID=A0A163GTW7_9BACL|nr:hypothetical protein [Paenibacillus glucanolyticus]KZS45148.1 hypothetical protein AWU65_03965 [Paenibacillus glucanolyticus]OMF64425.1 hypothetical protein BK142_31910 [Paenibacillus glucanolyticus]
MTREEFISNYPLMESGSPLIKLINLIIISVIIGVFITVLVYFFFLKISREVNRFLLFLSFALTTIISIFLLTSIFDVSTKPTLSSELNHSIDVYKWKNFTFHEEYLPYVALERYEIIERTLNNGKYSVVLDTDKSIKIVETSKIQYTNSEKPYVEAKWVGDLSEYEIYPDFHEVTLYLPKR